MVKENKFREFVKDEYCRGFRYRTKEEIKRIKDPNKRCLYFAGDEVRKNMNTKEKTQMIRFNYIVDICEKAHKRILKEVKDEKQEDN